VSPHGPSPKARPTWRRRVYELSDPTFSTPVEKVGHNGLIALILINVAAGVLESVPAIGARFETTFIVIEVVSGIVFTIEYLLRLWSCVEHMPYRGRAPLRVRLAWMRTPAATVDLLSILPFYLLLIAPVDLRVFLLFRLVRFFKLMRYSPGIASLVEAVRAEQRALAGTFLILGGLVLTMATLMHLVERHAQPDSFGTVPDAMWWAVVTLTTVGYGDVVPVTALGKVTAGVTAVMGFAMLALPVGIIANAFAEVIHRRAFVVTWSMVARVPVFADLDAVALAEIMQLLNSRTFRKGEVISRRGEKASSMYFVISGEVEVETGDHPRLGPGEFFGEIAILTDEARTATVRTREETHLLVLHAHDLERLMNRIPEIGTRVRAVAKARAPHRAHRVGDAGKSS
jgi:voltage-gated potassium channel